MNKTLILITGLPGSGKSTLAKTLTCPIFDDDSTKNSTDLLEAAMQDPSEVVALVTIDACYGIGRNIIQAMCYKYRRPKAVIWSFENDVEQCLKNVKNRNDDRLISEDFIRHLSQRYDVEKLQPDRIFSVWH